MAADILAPLGHLSDAELVRRLKGLAAREREVTADLIIHLAELERRDLHFKAGYGSLFVYCRDALLLSEAEAYNRIEASRAARRYPLILDMFQDGSINLTTIRLLGRYLTAENHRAVLQAVRGKRKAQVEEVLATLWPRPDVPPSIRKLPAIRLAAPAGESSLPTPPQAGESQPAPAPGVSTPADQGRLAPRTVYPTPADQAEPSPATMFPTSPTPAAVPPAPSGLAGPAGVAQGQPSAAGSPAPALPLGASPAPSPSSAALLTTIPPARPPVPAVAALSPDRYRVQFTIGLQTLEKLRLAKDMLRHAVPSGDEATILDRALTVLLAELAKKKFADTNQPRSGQKTAAGSRHVPAGVRRAVWRRDVGRCAFVAKDGRRCAERALLEFHHVEPYAIGGEATVANVQLRCRRHNGYEARLAFGGDRMWPAVTDSSRRELARAAGGPDSSRNELVRGAGEPDSSRNELVRAAPVSAGLATPGHSSSGEARGSPARAGPGP